MDFLGIGPLELVTILLIIFIVMGPTDMVKMGATLGRTLRSLRSSEFWRAMQDTTRQLRNLPDNLARQAGIDEFKEVGRELQKDIDATRKEGAALDRQFTAWTRQPDPQSQKTTAEDQPEEEPGPGEES
jgi:Sec-independent protein translocase protein TatA